MRAVAMAMALVGCGTDTTDGGTGTNIEQCLRDPIELTCGTGEEQFELLASGTSVLMHHGPQGGWHVATSITAKNSEQDVALLPTITVPSQGDLKISSTTAPGDFVALSYDTATCEGTYVGQQARLAPDVVDPNPDNAQQVVCGWAGETFHLRLDVTDLNDGRTASCEVDVIAELDPTDVPLCE